MANSLKTLRRFRNMTQEKLSAETGITARTIQNYESDISNLRKASYENLVSLAKALNVSVDDIFLDDVSEFLKLPKPN
ncbi:TPA: helix-turn-helix transcriptional regulator [Streptococcus suis]|nr:helix-turn-helix transcriptional regulator [Streptococcus suis]HEM4975111.1 helix-turn-helix transcriptional regulator [Streptococcus suis]HEM5288955.1 helix-turn-helix transcriptional regulator [Streptococcus suis]HEM5299146.1 helix-turn-helix transcriptional regulator [Streptococcus suis]HEM5302675.1 helix-turn-helix transcriptional regulator [Streptococcus suis]